MVRRANVTDLRHDFGRSAGHLNYWHWIFGLLCAATFRLLCGAAVVEAFALAVMLRPPARAPFS